LEKEKELKKGEGDETAATLLYYEEKRKMASGNKENEDMQPATFAKARGMPERKRRGTGKEMRVGSPHR